MVDPIRGKKCLGVRIIDGAMHDPSCSPVDDGWIGRFTDGERCGVVCDVGTVGSTNSGVVFRAYLVPPKLVPPAMRWMLCVDRPATWPVLPIDCEKIEDSSAMAFHKICISMYWPVKTRPGSHARNTDGFRVCQELGYAIRSRLPWNRPLVHFDTAA